jgi:hypothetical protein
MVAPEVRRVPPPNIAGERELLEGWLDFHRATLLTKCAGLTDEQLKQRTCPPSDLSLLGLVRHMTEVENGWFAADLLEDGEQRPYSDRFDSKGAFGELDSAPTDQVFAAFLAECERSRRLAAQYDLDFTYRDVDEIYSLRWVYLHMIEEYARHNGHADLLRERIDGAVGD